VASAGAVRRPHKAASRRTRIGSPSSAGRARGLWLLAGAGKPPALARELFCSFPKRCVRNKRWRPKRGQGRLWRRRPALPRPPGRPVWGASRGSRWVGLESETLSGGWGALAPVSCSA
jgi:hypothetical protein